jgi:hypothetical protein
MDYICAAIECLAALPDWLKRQLPIGLDTEWLERRTVAGYRPCAAGPIRASESCA